MWLLSDFLLQWQQRLARLLEISQPEAGMPPDWIWRIRTRILEFLVSRYSDPVAMVREQARSEIVPHTPVETFCAVEPMDSLPRPKAALKPLLRAVKDSNFEAKRRLRWRWL